MAANSASFNLKNSKIAKKVILGDPGGVSGDEGRSYNISTFVYDISMGKNRLSRLLMH